MNNFLKQSLTGLWKEVLHVNRPRRFEEILGHDDIKQILQKLYFLRDQFTYY